MTEHGSDNPRIVFLAGLPRSGSTLLCNLLAMHSQIAATPTSPLCNLVESLRKTWSYEASLLAQLDGDFDRVYTRLSRSMRAFMEAWSSEESKPLIVDKNRGWLFAVETLEALYPNFQLIICLRDLRDIYASIERQHRRTILLSYPDRTDSNLVDVRASQLFGSAGIIGGPLSALYNLGDTAGLVKHLYFWRFEDFLADPPRSLMRLILWLGIAPEDIKLDQIEQITNEADSYYHFKYPHRIGASIRNPESFREVLLSPRIVEAIFRSFAWYYRQFYGADGVDLEPEKAADALRLGIRPFGLE